MVAEAWERTLADMGTAQETEDVQEMREALEAFKALTGRTMDNRTAVCWLVDHFEHELAPSNTDLGAALGISSAIVGRYITERGWHIRRAYEDDRDARDLWQVAGQSDPDSIERPKVHPTNLADREVHLIECGAVLADADWSPYAAPSGPTATEEGGPRPGATSVPEWWGSEMAEIAARGHT